MDVMSSVINRTAQQLGVSEDQVTLETVIPDVFAMTMFVAMDTGRAIQVSDLQAVYTVERAIQEFER